MEETNQQSQSRQPLNPTSSVNSSNSKLIPIILGVAAVAVIGIGAYLLGTKQSQVQVQNIVQTTPIPSPTSTPIVVPTKDSSTANWKIYNNSYRNYQFKYPNDYFLEETKRTESAFEGTSLKKDIVTNKDAGFGGGDTLRNGVVDNFTIFPNKNLSEAELKSEFGTGITIQNTILDGKNATEVLFNNTYRGRLIFYKYDNGDVLSISSYAGYEATKEKEQEYLSEFNQILSTFQFTTP